MGRKTYGGRMGESFALGTQPLIGYPIRAKGKGVTIVFLKTFTRVAVPQRKEKGMKPEEGRIHGGLYGSAIRGGNGVSDKKGLLNLMVFNRRSNLQKRRNETKKGLGGVFHLWGPAPGAMAAAALPVSEKECNPNPPRGDSGNDHRPRLVRLTWEKDIPAILGKRGTGG